MIKQYLIKVIVTAHIVKKTGIGVFLILKILLINTNLLFNRLGIALKEITILLILIFCPIMILSILFYFVFCIFIF